MLDSHRDWFTQLSGGFELPYRGDAPQRFHDAVVTSYVPMYDGQWPSDEDQKKGAYGRTIPIIQSSGTGKSRMVHELRNLWPTLILTLRRNANMPTKGFPVAEAGVVSFFFERFELFDRADLAFLAFFIAWLDRARKELEKACNSSKPPISMGELFALWHPSKDTSAFGKGVREGLFQEVCESADSLRTRFPEDFQGPVPANEVAGPAAESDEPAQKLRKHLRHLTRLMEDYLVPILNRLQQLLCDAMPVKQKRAELDKTADAVQPTIFYIAIDEFTLLDTPTSTTPSESLCRCIALLSELHGNSRFQIWFLLLDTTSAVAKALPAQAKENSERAANQLSVPAWWDIGFDLLWRKGAHPKSALDVLTLDHLKLYGRPLWSIYASDQVLDSAVLKLVRTDGAADLGSASTVAALFSQRCCMDLLPLRPGSQSNVVARELVESHMRYLCGLENDAVCKTTVHSEPMLALAAWFVLLKDPKAYSEALETLVSELISLGRDLDLVGSHGEFLARLLLVMARDAAFKIYGTPNARRIRAVEALSLDDFLGLLVAEPISTQVKSKLSGIAADAWLSFTHIIPFERGIRNISQDQLWHLWKRGAGIQCHHDEQGIDGLLPVFLGSAEDLSSSVKSEIELSRRMSYVGWQVKNRKEPKYGLKHLHGPPIVSSKFGPTPDARTSSVMTILLELGTEAKFRGSGSRAEVVTSACPTSEADDHCKSFGGTTVLKLRGRTSETYGCLDRLDVATAFGKLVKQVDLRQAPGGGTRSDYLMPELPELCYCDDAIEHLQVAQHADGAAQAENEDEEQDDSGEKETKRSRLS
ncbi:uncharacterized protein PSFLO_05038 [Pseudozyma flocculosa]|uniref:Uncharacterized protein n=1 Tax=Pseudozyma flocculosa TaxID=84751 RepID=A0A5C3F781_9BASI|nr:uncharacterized protein PSFLO_05038 [Pseudozyma flocculosa]